VWLDHLALTLDLFIKCSDDLKEMSKEGAPAQDKDGANAEAEEDLLPLAVSRSISLPVTPGQVKAKP
jgi:hypothetical protein